MILRKAAIYSFGEFSGRLAKSLSIYLLAYLQTKEQFGAYSYIIAVAATVVVVLDFGLNSIVILRASVQHFRSVFTLVLLAKCIVVVCVTSAILGINAAFPLFQEVAANIVMPFLAISVAWDLQAFLGNALRARLDFVGEAWVKVTGSVGFLLVLGGLGFFNVSMTAVVAIWAQAIVLLGSIAIGILRLRTARLKFPGWETGARRGIRSILRLGLPLVLTGIGAGSFNSIESLVLGFLSEFTANATFSVAHKLGLLSQLPIGVALGFLLPQLAAKYSRGLRPEDRHFVDRLITISAVAAAGVSQAYMLTMEWIVIPLLSSQYADASHVAAILALYIVPNYVYSVLGTVLFASRHILSGQILFAGATAIAAILDYIVVLTLQPLLVAWVSVAMHWMILAGFFVLYRKFFGGWPAATTTCVTVSGVAIGVLVMNFVFAGVWKLAFELAVVVMSAGGTALALWRARHAFGRIASSEIR